MYLSVSTPIMAPQQQSALAARIQEEAQFLDPLKQELQKAIVGQEYMVERLLLGLLSGGHILLEGVPGLAKTLAIKSLAKTVSAAFSRIQFTPDLLPADVIGTQIYNQKTLEFLVKKGPIFANFVLADEINRSPAKVQSALLEAMAEHQVTIGEESFRLDQPFLVMATQNPLEQEGTYALPEAQLDRFMLKCVISYPTMEDERQIIRMNVSGGGSPIQPTASLDQIRQAQKTVREVFMDDKIEKYILQLVFATRDPEAFNLPQLAPLLTYGGSPRASINLAMASKAYAFLQKRAFVIPEDVKAIVQDVLRHRIGLSYEAEAENMTPEEIIAQIIRVIPVP